MDVKEAVRDCIVDELDFSGPRAQLTDDYKLLDNQVIDSLGIFKIVSYLEDRFNIEIDDDDLLPDNFETIDSIAALVGSKVGDGA